MDVHKDSIVVAILRDDETKAAGFHVPNDPKSIRKLARRLKKGVSTVLSCYEAGPCGYTLARQLRALDVECVVVATSLIPSKPGDRVKTDRRDAEKLAGLFRANLLTMVREPNEEQEAIRDLVRARGALRKAILVERHHVGKFLLRHGRKYTGKRNWTKSYWRWLRQQEFEQRAARSTFGHYRTLLEELEQRLKELDAELAELSTTEPYRDQVARLRCLRGIDTLSAMVLVAEIFDFRRFGTAEEFMSFLGLVPSEHTTGGPDKAHRGPITKAGNSHARRILVEAAWHARHRPTLQGAVGKRIQGQPEDAVRYAFRAQRRLHKRFWKMVSGGKVPQKAAVAVARELAGFVWGLATEQYDRAA